MLGRLNCKLPSGCKYMNMIAKLEDVGLKWKEKTLIERVSLTLPEESLTALLGPNGAGKTTAIRCLTGLISPTSGRVLLFGKDLQSLSPKFRSEIRAELGIQADTSPYLNLTAAENIEFWARVYGLGKISARTKASSLMDLLGIIDRADDKVGSFSKGMRQKVSLAGALVGSPRLLVLDEPTSGLDPQGSKDLMAYISEVRKKEGASVLLSSHRLPGLEQFATHATFLSKGRTIADGSICELRNSIAQNRKAQLSFIDRISADEAARRINGYAQANQIDLSAKFTGGPYPGHYVIEVEIESKAILPTVNKLACESGGLLTSAVKEFDDLESIYFSVMKEREEFAEQ